ncbi:MAG: c-type cytochrome [Syntrophobacteraceae bacterium]|nr:c-type cytochrome [Syntrophobacteraceae bacterium]
MRKAVSCLAVVWLAVTGGVVCSARGGTGGDGLKAGERLFKVKCAGCHPGGSNVVQHNRPVMGSPKLSDFDTFNRFIRRPTEPDGSRGLMPSFRPSTISDAQSRQLYDYIARGLEKK